MVETVKRTYTSALRARQAQETRQTIVAAATRLFVERGFGQTTIDAVAEASGVSRKTVFSSVGGKVELLRLAHDWSLVGDDEPIALHERPEVRSLMLQTDPVVYLKGWAQITTGISARTASIYRAVIAAAGQDESARELLDEKEKARRSFMAQIVIPHLRELRVLREGLSIDHAVDIAWLHSDPDLYGRLVLGQGWTRDQFEAWVQLALCQQLLAP